MEKQNITYGGITILGLGPGGAELLSREAWDWLNRCRTLILRTRQHPAVADLPEGLTIESFDSLYEENQTFEGVYEQIIERVLEKGESVDGVTYGVPGHPFVAEATVPEICRRAKAKGIPVRVIEGISFLEPTFTALEIDPYPNLILVDAMELAVLHHPGFPPTARALVAQIYSRQVASNVKLTLNAVYPDTFAVRLVHAAGTKNQIVEDVALYEIDRSEHLGLLSSLYIPQYSSDSSFEAFQEVVAALRAPDGCPWDLEQTHQTLRTHLMGEMYEALEAMDINDPAKMAEEFGDLLLQIVLNAQIGWEDGEFSMVDVLEAIHRKIVRRHPHVFGDLALENSAQVITNWEKIKEGERKENGETERKGILDGVPRALPALAQSQEVQDRAARVGFDWADVGGVLEKIQEEIGEIREAVTAEEKSAELGDLLFVTVNLARWMGVDAESALRETNARFRARFSYMEDQLRNAGKRIQELSFDEMNVLWEQAKDALEA